MAGFDPQRSAVYRLARRHTRAVRTLLEGVDYRGYSDEVNQLRRSAGSMVANLREDQITALLITLIRNIDRGALTRDQDARQEDPASPR